MHILIIPSWYKTKRNPVSGSFFEEQARGFQKKGFQVGIFHVGFKSFSFDGEIINREYDDNGLPTYYYNFKATFPKITYINYLIICIKAYSKFRKYVSKHGRPDVIHIHSVFWGGIVGQYISKRTQIPYVITEHLTNFLSGGIYGKTDLYFTRKVFDNSKINIVVSNSFKTELTSKLGLKVDNFVVIHNLVASFFFDNFHVKKVNQNGDLIFFTNSFINERKNHKMLINAFQIFNKEYPKSKLFIGGDAVVDEENRLMQELIKYVYDLNLNDKIIFLGPLTRMEVKNNLENCHAFLLASRYETFGVVLIEALASGRPIISTNSKGPIDIVEDYNGYIVDSFSEIDFASAMIKMIQNYYKFNQTFIRTRCKEKFGEEIILDQLIDIYKRVLRIN